MPITIKLSIVLLLASLIPLSVASFYSTRRGLHLAEQIARRNLELAATTTATRLDQLFVDTERVLVQLSRQRSILELVDPSADAEVRALAQSELDVLVGSNIDYASAFVINAAGKCVLSTDSATIGLDLNFRAYVKRALAGEVFVSEILIADETNRPGIYFAGPVVNAESRIIGAAVLQLQGEVIWHLTDDVIIGARGYTALSDENGIVISHPNKELLFNSLGPLADATIESIDPETNWGRETIPSMNIPELHESLVGVTQPGTRVFMSRLFDEEWIVGFAPMKQKPWAVSVLEPREQFAAPMATLERQIMAGVIGVGLLATVVALVQARGIVRPLKRLTDAAARVADGNFDARVEVRSRDELGMLASAFNSMVPRLEEGMQMRQALSLAMEVQQNLLPSAAPPIDGLEIAGFSRAADETGGDYYDFIDLQPWSANTLAVAVGDVTGHGVAAALLMTTARALLRSQATPPRDLAATIASVNDRLCDDTGDGRFMTLFYSLVDASTGQLRYVVAGHDPATIYDPKRDTFTSVEGRDLPLGILPESQFTECTSDALGPGCIMLVGTDGIWEARNHADEMFGKDRMREILRRHATDAVEDIVTVLTAELDEFRAGRPQVDDITMVVIRRQTRATHDD